MRARIWLLLFLPLALFLSHGAVGAVSLEGTWSGAGMVNPNKGQREQVRCRITYKRESAKVFSVAAKCATSSVKMRQTGKLLEVSPSRYVGEFYNSDYDVSGRVRVIVKGSAQTVTFQSPRGSGSVTLRKN